MEPIAVKKKSFAVPVFNGKHLLLLCVICTYTLILHAQDRSMYIPPEERNQTQYSNQTAQAYNSPSRFFVGGNFGFTFLGDYNYIGISPLIGYRLTPWFSPGINLNLNFVTDKTIPDQTAHYTTIGAGLFTRFFPFQWLYLQVQPEYNQYQVKVKSGGTTIDQQTYHVFSLLMGGGYVQRISENSYFNFGVLYDVIQNPHSPYYGIPVIQGGINLGF
jgi:hypothetical protein